MVKALARVVWGDKGIVKAILNRDALAKPGSIEKIDVGSLVLVEGEGKNFLGLVIDTSYDTQSDLASRISFFDDPRRAHYLSRIIEVFGDSLLSTSMEILLLGEKLKGGRSMRIASSLPVHFSSVRQLSEREVEEFFGREDRHLRWGVGTPETPNVYAEEKLGEIPINVKTLSKLSFGIFGKTGTGKTFLGNLLAAFLTAYNTLSDEVDKPIVTLIFDMHSEYGGLLRDAYGNIVGEGVGQKLRGHYVIYTPDFKMADELNREVLNKLNRLTIPITEINLERELTFMKEMLGLTDAFISYLPKIKSVFKRVSMGMYGRPDEWRRCFWEYVEEKEEVVGEVESKIDSALYRSLAPNAMKLKWITEQDFVTWEPVGTIDEAVNTLLGKTPRSVIVSMGKYSGNTVAYMLIANHIARKLMERIDEAVRRGEELNSKITIFLEEAHTFLGPRVFINSPFGVIAREYRKRGVNLAVIDQRPSELDENVMSMLWSKFIFALTSKRDLETALLGTPFQFKMEEIVSRLPEKKALITGLIVDFPVVVNIVNYKSKMESIVKTVDEKVRGKPKVELFGEGEGEEYYLR